MKTIINPGKVKIGKMRRNIFCKISFIDGDLSISGVIGPMASGNCFGSCGQIDMGFKHSNPDHDDKRTHNPIKPSDIDFTRGWNSTKWYKFLEYWKLYHLNDLQAGCEHQRELGWNSYDEHPAEPCPVCGYKYGTAWLKVDVPENVIDFLFGLPITTTTPAWV